MQDNVDDVDDDDDGDDDDGGGDGGGGDGDDDDDDLKFITHKKNRIVLFDLFGRS